MKVKTVEEGFCIKDEAKGVGIKAYLVDLSPNVCVYKNGATSFSLPFCTQRTREGEIKMAPFIHLINTRQ